MEGECDLVSNHPSQLFDGLRLALAEKKHGEGVPWILCRVVFIPNPGLDSVFCPTRLPPMHGLATCITKS